MNINDVYGGGYLKAADLAGREVTVTIERVELVKLEDGQKLCLYFYGKEKGLLLNKTNGVNVASMYGPQTDGWIGKPITIGTSWVDFQGKSVEAIRVRPRAPQQNGGNDYQAPQQHQPVQQRQAPPPQDYGQARPVLDDEIPF